MRLSYASHLRRDTALVLLIGFWYFRARMKIVVAFGLCLVLFSLFAGDRGVSALLQARRDEQALSRQVSALRSENARLKQRAEALRKDASAIEAVARETLGLARADEIVVTRPR
jgi:cell division protein FtsB